MPRTLVAALVAALAVAVPACGAGARRPSVGSGKGLDTVAVEKLLVATQKKASPDLEVGKATCPPRVQVIEGGSFPCTVLVEGVEAPYVVTTTGVDIARQTAHFALRPAKAIISSAKAVAFLTSQTSPGATNTRVECPGPPVRVFDPGTTFECTVADGRGSQVATLRVDDVEGRVTVVGTR